MAVNKDGVYIAEDKDFEYILGYWIYQGRSLEVDITNFVNSKKLESTGDMFNGSYPYEATAVKKVVLGENSVTNMPHMFSYSQATSLDLSDFDVSSVTGMNNMFRNSQATTVYVRTQADADKFNSSSFKPSGLVFKVVYKDGVYIAQDKDFQSINDYWVYKGEPLEVDITDFVNSKNLTSLKFMFSGLSEYGSTAVKRVVLGKNRVTNMSYMFHTSQATSLDLSGFDTSSVTNMLSMFYRSQATSLDLSGFDTSSVTNMTNMSYMFQYSQAMAGYARTQADADKFNSSSNKPSGLVFKAVYKDGVYIAQDKDFQLINGYWIYKGGPLEVDITEFVNSKNLTSTEYMFSGSAAYKATAVERVVLGKNSVTNMADMFRYSQATSLDLSSFDTSKVINMSSMFYDSLATSLDLSSFNASSVTDMSYMFCYSKATSLDLSNFDTSSVTDMSYMFYYSQATSLDLSSFDTSSVTNMSYMFRYSQATTGYARTQADADKFNSSSYKPAGLVFVATLSFGRLDNLKIKFMSYKDSNGMIKQVKTLKYKDNLGNITKLK